MTLFLHFFLLSSPSLLLSPFPFYLVFLFHRVLLLARGGRIWRGFDYAEGRTRDFVIVVEIGHEYSLAAYLPTLDKYSRSETSF